jgi:hypothetical protein
MSRSRLVLVPADLRIEKSARYARAAEQRQLLEETEQQMLGASSGPWIGVDMGTGIDPTVRYDMTIQRVQRRLTQRYIDPMMQLHARLSFTQPPQDTSPGDGDGNK